MLTGKTWWTQCTFQRGPLLARRTWASLVVLPGLQQRRVSGPESPLRIIQSRLKSDNPWSQSHVQTFNNNLKELGVVESKRNAIWKGFVHELLNAQDTVLCSYFAKRSGAKVDGCGQKSTVEEVFHWLKDWIDLNKTWWKTVRRNMDRKTMRGKHKRASWRWKVGAGREG